MINLTNLDNTLVGVDTTAGSNQGFSANTVLDNVNVGDALSNGGLFGGAANILDQRAYNQLNAMGVTAPGVVTPVVLGTVAGFPGGNPTTVEINMLTSAASLGSGGSTLSGTTSLTSTNTNTANVVRPNVIPSAGVGVPSLLVGYSAGPASVGGSQVGINSANALGAAFAPGTTVSLNQMPIGLANVSTGGPTTASSTGGQQGLLNMSSVNNLVAFTAQGSSEVNGSATGVDANGNPITVAGSQIAQNRFNTAAIYGDVALVLGQKADGLNAVDTAFTSANMAAAYSANLGSAGIDPTVRNLNQGAGVDINTLALAPVGGASGAVTLSGQQSILGAVTVSGPGGGTFGTVVPVVTNQMVASTVANSLAAVAATQPNAGGVLGGGVLALTAPRNFVNGAPAAADVGLSNVGQTIATAYNRVDAGNMAITALPATGSNNGTGFSQVANEIGAISGVVQVGTSSFGVGALNNALADTVAGRASIDGLAQNYQMTANTLNSSANVTGGFTQTANALNFAAGVAAPAGFSNGVVNQGSGGAAFAAAGQPYEVALQNGGGGLQTNSAGAVTILGGNASLAGTTQRTNVLANVLSTSAALTTTSAGAVEQNLGAIAGYGGTGSMQSLGALSGSIAGSGLASATGYRQDIGLTGNLVSASGLSGTVTQQGPSMFSDGTVNYAQAISGGRGDATIGSALLSGTGATSGIQTTALTMNRIDSTGTIGSAATPAALSQASGGVNVGNNLGFNGASNVAAVAAFGTSGNAVGNNLVQQASVNFNSLASTGLLVGNANQTSNGFLSANGNSATANAAGCGSVCNGTGNATLLGTQQVVGQTLNTMALAGGATGLLNQVAAGGTDILSRNTVRTQSANGYAINTGVQVATNGVNVISAAR
ncbi:beta strand repeat-containing protein [Falsiroseomonas sp.]|uniref:beta strand repeat-containing protein n=1 Tax=Falsiroseomonas sp. TaxID=2870721 RepID=UPI003F713BB7